MAANEYWLRRMSTRDRPKFYTQTFWETRILFRGFLLFKFSLRKDSSITKPRKQLSSLERKIQANIYI